MEGATFPSIDSIVALCDELKYAKRAVISCLDSSDTLVDMHGLEYWAGRVESLRKELKEKLGRN